MVHAAVVPAPARPGRTAPVSQARDSTENGAMKVSAVMVGLGLAVMSCLAPVHAATVQPYRQAAFDAARQSGDRILVFVEAPWCPTCARERPILRHLYATPEFSSLHVFDVDFDTSKPLLRKLGVQMQSTLIVYHGDRETGRLTGATDPGVIKRLLETSAQ
jgi:thioredoxin